MPHSISYSIQLRKKKSALVLFAFLSMLTISCKKFIEVPSPHTSLNAGNVYTKDATAAAVLTNIYAEMSEQNNTPYGTPLASQNIISISVYAGLGADELTLFDLNYLRLLTYYRNELDKTSSFNHWKALYPQIFSANNAIEGLNNSTALRPAVKQQLLGEALFIRAFCYFYLVNMYGDVPLVLNLDYKASSLLARAPMSQVYTQIITDLKTAQALLSEDYLKSDAVTPYTTGVEERVRPNKWAATALLSRCYLYANDPVNAEVEATKIINHTSLFNLPPLNEAFLKNSLEAIWQLQPVGNNGSANTGEGRLFVLPAGGPNASTHPVYLSNQLINSFETGDQRRLDWVDSVIVDNTIFYYAYKYKIGDTITTTQEYPTIMRLAEQYLIRAEARTEQNKISGAQSDLNMLRQRAGLSPTTAKDKTTLLNAILQERRVELFTEWGHRWFDLKRTQKINAVMQAVAPLKGGTWSPFKALYPLPQTDIDKDPNLIQNSGYN